MYFATEMKGFKLKIILLAPSIFLLLSFSLSAQQLSLFEEPGGGGGTTTTQSSLNNDNTTLYLVGGAVITGIVIYALLQRDKKKSEVEDSSKAVSDLINIQSNQPTGLAYEMQKVEDKIPVDLFFGSRKNFTNSSESMYMMGLSFRF